MYICIGIFLIVVLLFLIINSYRKSCIIKKVRSMCPDEKCDMLNGLIKPLGYKYVEQQDIFVSTIDAWQKKFGYTQSYDFFAPFFNMVFDSERIYFDYDNKTWLVELWKGQYGINTGSEIGIYCADGIVPPHKRSTEIFSAVSDEDMPVFSMTLRRKKKNKEQTIAKISMKHWWLAAFCMGCFSKPRNLYGDYCIKFPDKDMMLAFANALISIGYDESDICICGLKVCFSINVPKNPFVYGFFTKLIRLWAQFENRIFCKIYLFVTRDFKCTVDRLIYLYFYLPRLFRHCLRKYKKHCYKGERV